MSRQSLLKGIRDGRIRDLAKAARKMQFALGATKSDHLFLRCPTCQVRITFSKTAAGSDTVAFPDLLKRLRNHGLEYKGRGGTHVADPAASDDANTPSATATARPSAEEDSRAKRPSTTTRPRHGSPTVSRNTSAAARTVNAFPTGSRTTAGPLPPCHR
jgi:hypothetical protein